MRSMSEWTDFAGKPARFTGLTDSHRKMAKAPEWAYCPLWRFEELLCEAVRLGVTLVELQGDWDYPVGGESGAEIL